MHRTPTLDIGVLVHNQDPALLSAAGDTATGVIGEFALLGPLSWIDEFSPVPLAGRHGC